MKPVALVSLVLAGALATLASTAMAGESGRSIPSACQAEAGQYCPGMTPGDGKFGKCMKSHASQLSDGCKQAAREMRRAGEAGKAHRHNGASGAGTSGGDE